MKGNTRLMTVAVMLALIAIMTIVNIATLDQQATTQDAMPSPTIEECTPSNWLDGWVMDGNGSTVEVRYSLDCGITTIIASQ